MFTPTDNTSFVIHPDGMVETSTFGPTKPLLMQFTGLPDKNGEDLYEDDLVNVDESYLGDTRIPKHIGKVIFTCGSFIVEAIDLKETWSDIDDNIFTKIGNIHQNPELIK